MQNSELIKTAFINSSGGVLKFDSYMLAYAELLDSYITRSRKLGETLKILEVGVKDGGSLFAWRDIFGKNTEIIGLDINPECDIFNEEGFQIYIGDQGDEKVWNQILREVGQVDILIDDGSHLNFSQIHTVDFAVEGVVKDGGIVIVEDTHTSYIHEFSGKSQVTRNFYSYVEHIIGCMHTRASKLKSDPSSMLSHIKQNDIYARNILSVHIYESIFGFKIKRGLMDSKELRNKSAQSISGKSIPDMRQKSKLYL